MFEFKHFLSYSKNGLGSIHSDTILNGHQLTNYFVIKDNLIAIFDDTCGNLIQIQQTG